ncbi:glycosyltransferase family 4 protein [Aeromonas veronii]|uniref:glycosyltransferase family 4 protein n=1 Tax=Aeromonas veronii TaxID=654 RepID=UPI003F7B8EB8
MKILLDCRAIFDSGIGAYTREILMRLITSLDVSVIVFNDDLDRFLGLGLNVKKIHLVSYGRFSIKNIFGLNKLSQSYDFLFSPTFILYANRKKLIVTVHDVCVMDCRRFFAYRYIIIFKLLVSLNLIFSRKVLTISNFSKDRILSNFDFIQSGKIEVFYNGVNRGLFSIENKYSGSITDKLNISKNGYYLSVGNLKPHKNFSGLCKYWIDNQIDYKLVIVGTSDGLRTTESLAGGDSVIFTGAVKDSELKELYENARAFIYPSLYEGFGLPLLEAMQFKLPIIASDIPVFREIAGDSISYFNPHDFDGVKDFTYKDLSRINYDSILCKYSWDDSVENIILVLKNEHITSK